MYNNNNVQMMLNLYVDTIVVTYYLDNNKTLLIQALCI